MGDKGGRPTLYKKEYNKRAEKDCAIYGADDKQLAKRLEIAVSTLNLWKEKHPEFMESIKKGKDFFDTNNVEVSLLESALGYETIEIHKEECSQPLCRGTKTKTVTKYVKSVTAILFYLKNRNPERWRDIKAAEPTKGGLPGDNVLLIEAVVEAKPVEVKAVK